MNFSQDFCHTLTVILALVAGTLDNSNLLLTQSNFCFPSGHFLYNFTFNNLNNICQYVTNQNKQFTVVQNIKFILKQLCEKTYSTVNSSWNFPCSFPFSYFHVMLHSSLYSNLEMYFFNFHSTSLYSVNLIKM